MSHADDPPANSRAPGWHPHLEHAGVERHWDGERWTGEHRFGPPAGATPADLLAAPTALPTTFPGGATRGDLAPPTTPLLTTSQAATAPGRVPAQSPITIPWNVIGVVAGAVAVVALFVMIRALIPAPDAGTISVSCSDDDFDMRVDADYARDGERTRLYRFRYRLDGPGRGLRSNFRVRVRLDDRPVFQYRSPDDRGHRRTYVLNRTTEVARDGHAEIEFKATFDRADAFDPSCEATAELP